MRFGFGVSNFELIGDESLPAAHQDMLEQATLADALGFDSVWIAEQHFSPERQCPSPFLIGTAVAMRTQRTKIGVYTTMTFAHPIRIAEDAAVLDVLSGGRLILCAGTGYRPEEFAAYGVPAKGKRARVQESLEILSQAWTEAPVAYQGNHFTIPNQMPDAEAADVPEHIAVFPKPSQRPIPVWMAAFGNVGVRQAARLGLPLYTSPLERMSQLVERDHLYRTTLQEAGQTQSLFPLLRSVYVTDSAAQARADTEAGLMAQSRRYQRWRPQAGLTELFDELTADRFIIGDVAHCKAEIERYMTELGTNYIVCRMNLPGLSHAKVVASMQLFAKEVMPHFV